MDRAARCRAAAEINAEQRAVDSLHDDELPAAFERDDAVEIEHSWLVLDLRPDGNSLRRAAAHANLRRRDMPERGAERVRYEHVALLRHHQIVEETARACLERRHQLPRDDVVDRERTRRPAGHVEPAGRDLHAERGSARSARDEHRRGWAIQCAAIDRAIAGRAHEESAAARVVGHALWVAVRGRAERKDLCLGCVALMRRRSADGRSDACDAEQQQARRRDGNYTTHWLESAHPSFRAIGGATRTPPSLNGASSARKNIEAHESE